MIASAARTLRSAAPPLPDEARRMIVAALLFAAIGVEISVLATWLPDTLRVWFHPEREGYGDFPSFYRAAESFHLNATYSPGLAVLMRPLTYMSMRPAFMLYTGVNVAALLGVAYVAQRGVRSVEAKVAVALGVLALPQTHWAIRAGHFTEVLALATLLGLLLADRRPVVAGLLIGVLALKPQYLPVPLLYFAFTHNWRALAASTGALAALALAGLLAAFAVMGPDAAGYVRDYYTEAVPYVARNLTAGQQDGFYVHAWQYSWYGFLLSVGLDPNPLVAADLLVLSLAATVLCWWRCTPSVAKAGVVLGMLLLAPHSTFYNWSMIAAAGALLLRSDARPRWLVPALIVALALAMAATQNATPFPIPADRFRPPETRGWYWAQPAAVGALFALALAAGRALGGDAVAALRPRSRDGALARLRAGARFAPALAAVGVCSGFALAAYVAGTPPFARDTYFSRGIVLSALPADFPAPRDARIDSAGAGSRLPYRIEWRAPAPVSEVAGIMRERLADGSWRIVGATGDADGETLRTARGASAGEAPVVGEISVTPAGAGSMVRLEFSPLPASAVPGYARWLESVGIVVHNVEPGTALPELIPGRAR